MNIVIFSDTFLPQCNGIATSLTQLIKGYLAEKHSVLVVTPKAADSDEAAIPGAQIYFTPSVPAVLYPELKLGFFSPKLVNILREFNADVIHIASPITMGFTGLMYGKMTGKPVFGVFHTYFMEPEYLKIIGLQRLISPLNKFLWKFTKEFYNLCDYVISPSEYVSQDLIEHGIDRSVTVIHNPLDISAIETPASESFIEKLRVLQKRNRKYLLNVGRMSKEKSVDKLISTFAVIARKRSDVDLVIVGNGPELSQLKLLAKELGIEERVIFFGEVTHQDLLGSDLFSLAKSFVTLSTSEVQPMSIIEAMYFGLPIIACKSRGMAEMVDGNGFLVEADDKEAFCTAVDLLLDDEALGQKMKKRSKLLTKKYSLAVAVQKHCELYETALKQKK
ncbi:glycosyltransferase [Candidatus Woesebacteria bacterium]|nr:glycosyltransferase [Candidatus Woesebacteria bacterium]